MGPRIAVAPSAALRVVAVVAQKTHSLRKVWQKAAEDVRPLSSVCLPPGCSNRPLFGLLGERWLDAFSKAFTGLRFVEDLQICDHYKQSKVCCIQVFVSPRMNSAFL